mmetsp:Transcript_14049/g.38393  ORF Transcript_14049/g.38393 Transcript_14049/m.38393 type:complete len:202 (+) Transcript_14049:111-716(+)
MAEASPRGDDDGGGDVGDGEDDGDLVSASGTQVSKHLTLASLGNLGNVSVPVKAGLTEKVVQDLREIFGLFEEEGSGIVIPNELRTAVGDAGLERDNPELWKLLAGFSSDEPMDFEEFVAQLAEPVGDSRSRSGVSRLVGSLGPEAAARGSIGIDNLKQVVRELCLDIKEDELVDMLDKAGVGSDGRLALDDFYAALQDPE